jgi:phosphatidylinositol alpha-mannosyltransferase
VLSLAVALRQRGDRVRVLGPVSGEVPRGCFGLGGVVAVAANGSLARVGIFVARRSVRRFLSAGRFDVIHVHEPWLPGIARHAVRAARVPVVGTFHCYSDTPTLAVRMARRALGHHARHMGAAIAVSRAAGDFARSVFRGPTYLVPNGVDTGHFSSAIDIARHTGESPNAVGPSPPLRLLFVGRYDEPRKGLQHLLRAASLVRDRGRAVEVLVVGAGDGPQDPALARAANARFLGRLSDAALVDRYRTADIFCAPSTHGESFGLVLIEAMACGCPVIASDIRGYREGAAGAALLVPPGEPVPLAEAIVRLADNAAVRRQLAARGHRRAEMLSWDILVRDIQGVYHSLTSVPRERALGASA